MENMERIKKEKQTWSSFHFIVFEFYAFAFLGIVILVLFMNMTKLFWGFKVLLFVGYISFGLAVTYQWWKKIVPVVEDWKEFVTHFESIGNKFYIDIGEEEIGVKKVKKIIDILRELEKKEKNAELLVKEAEINKLQNQINPHFLYNTLEAIRGEALQNKDQQVAKMTAALSNYFRYNISSKENFVSLKDELSNIKNYFTIQKFRFEDHIQYNLYFHGVEEEDVQYALVPKLILQPIVENAIYHGLELKMGEGHVQIHITATQEKLFLEITDDGIGMDDEQVCMLNGEEESTTFEKKTDGEIPHTGIALRNIKNRLKLYWGKDAQVIVSSIPQKGTEVSFVMPLVFKKDSFETGKYGNGV